MEELKDIYYGTNNTEISEILQMIVDLNWSGPLVTEIDARGVAKLLGQESKIITPNMLINVHSKITEGLRKRLGILNHNTSRS